MEKKTEKIEPVLIAGKDSPPPRPIASRKCDCGCGHSFQPNRKDQVYLNKQHADHAYNHGIRKKKARSEKLMNGYLRKNDRILSKYFNANKEEEVVCHYDAVIADGFNAAYTIGFHKIEEQYHFFTYNYSFNLFRVEGIRYFKIRKR